MRDDLLRQTKLNRAADRPVDWVRRRLTGSIDVGLAPRLTTLELGRTEAPSVGCLSSSNWSLSHQVNNWTTTKHDKTQDIITRTRRRGRRRCRQTAPAFRRSQFIITRRSTQDKMRTTAATPTDKQRTSREL